MFLMWKPPKWQSNLQFLSEHELILVGEIERVVTGGMQRVEFE